MVKRAKILAAYQVNLHCDKCGEIMICPGSHVSGGEVFFDYKCKCGHTHTTKVMFPYQQLTVDLEHAEEIPEPERVVHGEKAREENV